MAAVRELLIKWGFDVDDKQLIALDKNIKGAAQSVHNFNQQINNNQTNVFNQQINVTVNKVRELKKELQQVNQVQVLKKQFTGLKKILAPLAVTMGVMTVATGVFLKEASDMEQVEVAFETMLGSAELAKTTIKDLRDFAVNTPFNFKGVVDLSKRLLAFGFQAEELIPTMTRLGNIAAGVGKQKLPFLVLALGQVRTAGKLTGQELRQFTEAGVPLLEELAKTMGKSLTEIESLKRAGKISFKDVEAALESLTSGSGRFADLMIKQSKTLGGLTSNVIDMLQIFAAEVGKELLPAAKQLVKIFLGWFAVNKKIIKQDMVKIFKKFVKGIVLGAKIVRSFANTVLSLSKIFGGLGNVINFVLQAFLALTSIAIIVSLAAMALTLVKIVTAFKAIGSAALIAQAKALLFPILIGAAFVALLLIIDDFVGFLNKKDSVIGLLLKKMFGEETMNEIRDGLNSFINEFKEGFKSLSSLFSSFTFGNFKEGLKVVNEMLDSFLGSVSKILDVIQKIKDSGGFTDLLIKAHLKAFDKAKGELGFGGGTSDLSPSSNGGGVSINQPVNLNINVAPGSNASVEEVGESVGDQVEAKLGAIFRNAQTIVQNTQVS